MREAAGLVFAQDEERAVSADWGAAALKVWRRQVQTLRRLCGPGWFGISYHQAILPSSTTSCFL